MMEAWLHGCASDAQVPRLKELLDGLAAGPAADVAQLTVCLSAPPVDADSAATEVFLTRDVSRPQSTWHARHQSRPMSGEKAEKLGAAVRDVRQAATLSGDAYRLFCAMGFKMQYQVMRRGLSYRLLVSGHCVDVALVVLEGQGDDGRTAQVTPGLWLVEAVCATTQEAYPQAVAALMAVKAKLQAVVQLQRPSLRLTRPGEVPAPPARPQLGLRQPAQF